MFDQIRIERGGQVGNASEAAADELRASLVDQCLRLGMPSGVVGSFDEDPLRLGASGRAIELTLGGGHALGILEAVALSEQADVNGAAIHFVEVHVIGAAVAGGEFLEHERREVTAEQRIAFDKRLDRLPLGLQFLLNAADEYGDRSPLGWCGKQDFTPT